MKKTWENGKKTILGLILVQIWSPKFFLVGFITSSRWYTLFQAIIVSNFKEN